ncbi:metallothionein family 11-domain-containing protein [Yarrowia lipolytica]|uniref:YALI0C20060p n=2 Tax=Yarrowia lipolytica TaxID=4952 RepID=B5FVD1_YARLI|nr:YALI0C20060p [Yarrowia lipolytica CLIB122]KAB8281429.1 metallothionein family 11-domain-containing protein [Yarrowia lipolytica]KAE8173048.1 metallothionein family 11-domain-containing protein [Yarrowia lipolytica]RDW24177.1 metallothionein family 11-domain-containing protein [Yarrowia lipolytica]RDW30978.1 metallothionein family 11-domain-containing protein [Yarrowia lipolytica]RDW37817.1 metallothionein family 11-domain-containing protein [Yarrowia lipolytica]|eukprot:XP_002143038.1 YALI0C20060p [Yarrowia lipolytica CLIB122]
MEFTSAMFGASLLSSTFTKTNKHDLVNNCCCSSNNMPSTCACTKCSCKTCKC